MNTHKNKSVTIIGLGLAGSFLAILFAKRGYRVTIYERLAKKDVCDVASKRSYNIVLFGYGIEMLKQAGVWNDIKPHLLPLKGSMTYIPDDPYPIVTLTDPKKIPYFTVSRARLADLLLTQAIKQAQVDVRFETAVRSVDRHNKTLVVENLKSKKVTTIPGEVVIGADGINSLIRTFIQQGQQTNHLQEYADWNYKQFLLSPALVKKLTLDSQFVHAWTQKEAFVILHPDSNGALGALLVYPKQVSLQSSQSIHTFFTKHFPAFMPALKEITTILLANPEGNFATVHTDPWYYKDWIALVGDAAHGFYPFFGQGTSAAFGDCMQLIRLLDKYGPDWSKIFPEYQRLRKSHMDALGELSKEALLRYLRYKKADYHAIYDKLESMAYRFFPTLLVPPLAQSITADPAHAATHRENYLKQKHRARLLGVPIVVHTLTALISLGKRMR
jgi:kynurenine 3-monooxygenase